MMTLTHTATPAHPFTTNAPAAATANSWQRFMHALLVALSAMSV
jgi:hypothetical protein